MGFVWQTQHSMSVTSLLTCARVGFGIPVRVCVNGSRRRQKYLAVPTDKQCLNLAARRLLSMVSWNAQDSMKPHFSLRLLRVVLIVLTVHDHKNCLKCSKRSRFAYPLSQ